MYKSWAARSLSRLKNRKWHSWFVGFDKSVRKCNDLERLIESMMRGYDDCQSLASRGILLPLLLERATAVCTLVHGRWSVDASCRLAPLSSYLLCVTYLHTRRPPTPVQVGTYCFPCTSLPYVRIRKNTTYETIRTYRYREGRDDRKAWRTDSDHPRVIRARMLVSHHDELGQWHHQHPSAASTQARCLCGLVIPVYWTNLLRDPNQLFAINCLSFGKSKPPLTTEWVLCSSLLLEVAC